MSCNHCINFFQSSQ